MFLVCIVSFVKLIETNYAYKGMLVCKSDKMPCVVVLLEKASGALYPAQVARLG